MEGMSFEYNTAIYLFDLRYDDHLKDIMARSTQSLSRFSTAEAYVQEERAIFLLDLALASPVHTNWRRHARKSVLLNLPYSIEEFFLAENVLRRRRFQNVFDTTIQFFREQLELYREDLERFQMTLLLSFEDVLFHDIWNKGTDRKIVNVQKYLRSFELLCFERFDDMFPTLLSLCTNPPLNCELTIDVLLSFCERNDQKMRVFELSPDVSSLEHLILHAKDMRFDFWGLWSGVGYLPHQFDYSSAFHILSSKKNYRGILIKYGFPHMAGPQEYGERLHYMKNIKFEGRKIIHSIRPLLPLTNSIPRTRLMLILDIFVTFGEFRGTVDADDMVKTLMYLFRSLPQPYVTPKEFHDRMQLAVVPEFKEQLGSIASKYADSEIFEGDFEVPMPRRLMHLCRVVVRKILADNFMLLDGIHELPIPVDLMTYLALEA